MVLRSPRRKPCRYRIRPTVVPVWYHRIVNVFVVVQETPHEASRLVGVYSSRHLAELAAFHPYSDLAVYEFELDAQPTTDAVRL